VLSNQSPRNENCPYGKRDENRHVEIFDSGEFPPPTAVARTDFAGFLAGRKLHHSCPVDEESDEEPLLTKRKKRGVNKQEANTSLFYWQLAGRPDQAAKEEERGTWTSPTSSTDMAARRKRSSARAPRPRHWRTYLSRIFRSRNRFLSLERADRRGRRRPVQDWGVWTRASSTRTS
jgi:hypothetical protein